ncbi:MAG: DUF6398 domain-containing protein [Chloroflexota bacterium]
MQPRYDEIVALTDAFCRERLNEEYAAMCRRLAAKLSRKRPSPLEGGRANTWAAGIAQTIGSVNFLYGLVHYGQRLYHGRPLRPSPHSRGGIR